jgi:rhodanese-related sulfurtransferase
MRNNKKVLRIAALVLALMFTISAAFASTDSAYSIRFGQNNTSINGQVIDNQLYIPIREVSDFTGGSISWDNSAKAASFNGVVYKVGVNAQIINNRLFVIADALPSAFKGISLAGSNKLTIFDVPKDKIVPIDPNLKYIDTAALMGMIKPNMATSATRTKYEQAPPEWDFVLIDSRPAGRYNEAHINGAINIPDANFDKLKHLLPQDKNKMLIFYCGGLECPLSGDSARKAKALGYTNVYVYQEGTPFWAEAGNYFATTPAYVSTLITQARVEDLKAKPVLLIDTRPYTAYFASHIPTAVQMDDTIFTKKYMQFVPKDKDAEIVVYCGGFFCGKSHAVARILLKEGYTNIKVLSGGTPAWEEAGLPMFGTKSSGSTFDITGGKVDRKLSPSEFKQRLEAGGNVVVVDIRNDNEVAAGMIKGAIHIPSGQINADPKAIAHLLPADKKTTLLIHCASGARAAGVIDKIAELGYENAFYLNSRIRIDASGNYSF